MGSNCDTFKAILDELYNQTIIDQMEEYTRLYDKDRIWYGSKFTCPEIKNDCDIEFMLL